MRMIIVCCVSIPPEHASKRFTSRLYDNIINTCALQRAAGWQLKSWWSPGISPDAHLYQLLMTVRREQTHISFCIQMGYARAVWPGLMHNSIFN